MRVAVLSDFHLGYERFAQDAFEQALAAMAQAVEDADAIVLAGDLFDTKLPKPEALSQAFAVMRIPGPKGLGAKVAGFSARDGRKAKCSVPIVAIHGTHEMRAKSSVNPIQLLESAGFLLNAHAAEVVLEKGNEKVAISGMGGVPERQAKDALETLAPKPIGGAFNIFVFHQTLTDLIPAASGSMSADDLPPGFDLYVSGHMHASSDTRIAGKRVLIPGSTVITQLRKEEEAPKGFYLFDTANGKAEFKQIKSRKFIFRELEFESASGADALSKARNALREILSSARGEKPVVRLRLSGTLSGAQQLDTSQLEAEFGKQAFLLIDRAVSASGLKEKVERARASRQGGASLREMGNELLLDKLKQKGIATTPELQEIIEMLSEARRVPPEDAIRILLSRQKAS